MVLLARPAAGQFGVPGGGARGLPMIGLKSPVPHQVFQRDAGGGAEIPVVLPDAMKDAQLVGALLAGTAPVRYADGKFSGVPPGGPYAIHGRVRAKDGGVWDFHVAPVFVGDLWVLAGQSNMEGVGRLVDVTPPHPKVMALGMDGRWVQAVEPLHWLDDSPDPVHSGDPATRAVRAAQIRATRTKGAGLGLPFGAAMANATGVPVGLVACAHGGTSMAQWSPSMKGQGGMSLYGSMLRQVRLAGGKVKGMLWYQGESDTLDARATEAYARESAGFIAAVRADLGQPELPFYFVQLGRMIGAADPRAWNTVQEVQRRLAEAIPRTALVATVDLELDDTIHVGTQGLKRVGERLARIAQRELFRAGGASNPTLESARIGPDNTLLLKFRGVNRAAAIGGPMMPGPGVAGADGLRPERHIGGFSIRAVDGREIPLIFEAAVGPSRDTVVLKLAGPPPPRSYLWYGWGLDPYCNLTDALDMAVPVFGPFALDVLK